MLRSELVKSVKTVVKALEEPRLLEVFRQLLGGISGERSLALLNSYREYTDHERLFGAAEQKLLQIFQLEKLGDLEFWAALLEPNESGRHKEEEKLHRTYHSINFATTHLPKILEMLHRRYDDIPQSYETKEKDDNRPIAVALITVRLFEDQQISTPQRLAITLEAVEGIYNVCRDLEDSNAEPLRVVGCDSGSDKSFDFLGAAKIVESVKEVILNLWDKIVYFREDKTGRRLELITQSLPILEKIGELKEKGHLEPEKAELLKRQITGSISNFVKSGATILEIEMRSVMDPKRLMQPETKLLAAPPNETAYTAEEEAESETKSPQNLESDSEFNAYMEQKAREFRESKQNGDDNPEGETEKE